MIFFANPGKPACQIEGALSTLPYRTFKCIFPYSLFVIIKFFFFEDTSTFTKIKLIRDDSRLCGGHVETATTGQRFEINWLENVGGIVHLSEKTVTDGKVEIWLCVIFFPTQLKLVEWFSSRQFLWMAKMGLISCRLHLSLEALK